MKSFASQTLRILSGQIVTFYFIRNQTRHQRFCRDKEEFFCSEFLCLFSSCCLLLLFIVFVDTLNYLQTKRKNANNFVSFFCTKMSIEIAVECGALSNAFKLILALFQCGNTHSDGGKYATKWRKTYCNISIDCMRERCEY